MKPLLLLIMVSTVVSAYAVPGSDEAELLAARAAGNSVYYTCITTPPITPEQITTCTILYTKYITTLTALNAPYPLTPTTSPSPYVWSPYDICQFEPSHFVFPPEGFPICPALPI